MKLKLSLVIGVLLLSASAWAAEWNHTYNVGAHPQMKVQTNDASIAVTGAPGNTISAHVTTKGWEIGEGGITITEQQSGDSVFLKVQIPNMHFNFGNRSVHIEISVPQATALDLASSDGSLHVSGVKAASTLRTSDGSIEVSDFTGNLQAQTSDGSIHIGGFDGALSAHTSDGSIHASGRFSGLDLGTSDGSLEVELQSGSHMGGDWNLRTSDGSISVRVASDFAATVDAHASDGHVDLQLPLEVEGRVEKGHIHGKLRGGGPSLLLHTSDGSITLRSL